MGVNQLPIVKLGKLLPQPYKNGIYKSIDSYGQGTPILRITDFDIEGNLVTDELKKLKLEPNEVANYRLSSKDIVVNRVNSLTHLGKSILWQETNGDVTVYESNMMCIQPDQAAILPEYLIRVLQSEPAREHFCKVAKRAVAQCSINQQDVKSLSFPLPTHPEQQKIVQIFFTWDKAIEKQEALIAAKQKRKKALMQQFLTGKKRFPGFKGEWKDFYLGDLFDERKDTGFHDLNLLSITREKGVIPRNEVERKDTSNNDKSKYLHICPGDIGYNTMRMWQGVSSLSELEGIVSPAYTICTPKQNLGGKFVAYLFKTKPVIHLFLRYSQGLTSDTWNLKFHHFSEIKVRIPDLVEQQKIASVLSAADKEIETHQKQLSALKQQKKGLMQQLLTGKKRVGGPEQLAAVGA